ncbi:MAG TPA: hypothetical protein EYQ27_10150 [Gemmatimonadetes bacterium]|nr:hypothetical protein [Gemmatimonadota bacterium]
MTDAKRRFSVPHPLVLLTGCVILAALASYVVPAGQFDRELDEATGRSVVVAGTYHSVERSPVNLFDAMVALPRGMAEAADVIFDGHHDIDRWDPRWHRGDVEVIRCGYLPPPDGDDPPALADDFAGTGSGERYVILALERGGQIRPMSMHLSLREGDVAQVAIHLPEAREAVAALESLGWSAARGVPEEAG